MEEWLYRGINATMHFEASGEVDVYFDAGEWDQEVSFPDRQAALDWIDDLPSEKQMARIECLFSALNVLFCACVDWSGKSDEILRAMPTAAMEQARVALKEECAIRRIPMP